ncbi:PAS domain S-box protein [Neobacillus vireti]|uniref:PAS domain S-box protein n=1 Tax=Neobacillus vireti TaxID=220686 RepID=UPI002FFFB20C
MTNYPDAIFVLDFHGQFVFVNSRFEKLTQFAEEELMTKKIQFLVDIGSLDKVFNYFHRAVLGQIQTFDCKISTKAGNIIDTNFIIVPIIVEDAIVGVYVVAKDITHYKRKKVEIRKIEEFYRVLTENVVDIILNTNRLGKIIYVSPSCEYVLGYKPEELIGKHLSILFYKDDLERASLEREKLLTNYENTRGSYRFCKKNGDFIWMESVCKPIIDSDTQNLLEVVTVFRDITERRMTEELMINSEKLNIAGQLAAGIAHEVRNPLTAIKGFLQLMEAQSTNNLYFDIIKSEMDRIELILSELLVLAKPLDAKFESENMNALINNVKTLIDTQAILNNVQIDIVYENGDLTIRCDKNQLKQVFINFLKNAIEAMPNGGNIIIEIKKFSEDKARILIKDTGIGIPQHILKRIGQPFITTKQGGTGLGIMISKQIIENHKGTVHFWSDEKGTMIEMILPF